MTFDAGAGEMALRDGDAVDEDDIPDDAPIGPDVLRVRLTPFMAQQFARRANSVVAGGRPDLPLLRRGPGADGALLRAPVRRPHPLTTTHPPRIQGTSATTEECHAANDQGDRRPRRDHAGGDRAGCAGERGLSEVSLTRILGGYSRPVLVTHAPRRRPHHLHRRADGLDQAGHLRQRHVAEAGHLPGPALEGQRPAPRRLASEGCWAWPSTRTTTRTAASTSTTRVRRAAPATATRVIAEYRRARNGRANPSSGRVGHGHRPAVGQPQRRHLAFGPDGLLYIGTGDGGGGGDPRGNGQKLLDAPGQAAAHRPARSRRRRAAPLPHAARQPPRRQERPRRHLGLGPAQPVALLLRPGQRRPLDRRRRPGRARGGRSLTVERPRAGQRARGATTAGACEGTRRYPNTGAACTFGTRPVHDYAHGAGRCSVTGGYVYRGPSAATWRGLYIAGDYCGRLFVLDGSGTVRLSKRPAGASPRSARTPRADSHGPDQRQHLPRQAHRTPPVGRTRQNRGAIAGSRAGWCQWQLARGGHRDAGRFMASGRPYRHDGRGRATSVVSRRRHRRSANEP